MSQDHWPSREELPAKQGLYDPRFEHDACGIGAIVDLNGKPNHDTIADALTMLERMEHRGGTGAG